jgi:hypothetical protein
MTAPTTMPLPTDEGIERGLPHNIAAERAILGAVLLNNSALSIAAQELRADDFVSPENGRIFAAMLTLAANRVPIDGVLVLSELERGGLGKETAAYGETAAYISQLPDGLPKATSVEHYSRMVKDDSCRRLALYRARAIEQAAFGREDVAELQKRFTDTADALQPAHEVVPTVSAKQLCAMKLRPRQYLLTGFLKERSMAEIFSWRGIGKTWVGLSLANAIASGGTFLKWQAPKPSRVLFVDGELDQESLQDRVREIGAANNENFELLCCDMLDDPFPHLATAQAQRIIEDKLGDRNVLMLDNLSALAPASNEREGAEWILIQSWLRELKRQGISTVFFHHAGHSGTSRGTTRREDLLDLVIELRRPKDYVASEGLRFELHFTKTRGMLAANAEPLEARLSTDLDGKLVWTYHDLEDARLAQIIELRSTGRSWREIETATGVPRSTAERLWKKVEAK